MEKIVMGRHPGYKKRWNIFARELENLLAARRIRLELLHEVITIFPDKARRLAQSLYEPGYFPLLNNGELEDLTLTCHLSHAEVLHLKAAVLATSVEKMLLGYTLDEEKALQTADTTFPFFLDVLQQIDDEANDQDAIRGDLFLAMDNTNDRALNDAYHSFDNGEMALYLSEHAVSKQERVESARQACHYFKQALEELDTAEIHIRTTQGWHDWRAEIQRSLTSAEIRLQALDR
jgi:hypothetical protein